MNVRRLMIAAPDILAPDTCLITGSARPAELKQRTTVSLFYKLLLCQNSCFYPMPHQLPLFEQS